MIEKKTNDLHGLDISPVLKAMKEEKMDALVAMEPHTVAVLRNSWNEIHIPIEFREFPTCVVILVSGDNFTIGSSYPSKEGSNMVEVLGKTLKKHGLGNGNIGFELGFVPVNTMEWIKSELPGIVALDGEWILWQLRAVKTEKQLGFIKKAVNACEAGFKEMLKNWQEGESIQRLLDRFEEILKDHDASFFGCYQRAKAKKWAPFIGRDQYKSEDFMIKANDNVEVAFDLLVRYQAYFSDWARAIYLGKPPEGMADSYGLKWRVVKAIAKEVKPGMMTVEAQEACDNLLKKEGMVHWWCIHSVGLEVHEEPLIGTAPVLSEKGVVDKTKTQGFPGLLRGGNRKITFEPNTVVMVESGTGVEDPYLMTKDGLERLNTLPQKLFVV